MAFNVKVFGVTLLQHPVLLLRDHKEFQDKWFGRFWSYMGPKVAANAEQKDLIAALVDNAQGVCLDLGPGAGDQMFQYEPVKSKITRLYGGEPNAALHGKLCEKAKQVFGSADFTVLKCGAQPYKLIPALEKQGIIPPNWKSDPDRKGVFDTIITIKSMCSIPDDELDDTLKIFQELLRPGGKYLFFEHVVNRRDAFSGVFQRTVAPLWPYLMNGCYITSKIETAVKELNGWEKCTVKPVGQDWEIIPFVSGIAIKS